MANPEERAIGKAFKLSGEAKIEGVCEFIDTLVDTGVKFILFAHHQNVMNAVQ